MNKLASMPTTEENENNEMPTKYMGKEVRAPRKAGRPRKYGEETPKKPIKEMTPDERKEYDAARKRRSVARKAVPSPQQPAITSEPSKPVQTRVFAPSQAVAEAVAGPGAVAITKKQVQVRQDTWDRLRKTAWGLRKHGYDMTAILDLAIGPTLQLLEEEYNDGQPFDEEPPDTSPTKGRTLRVKKKVIEE